MNKLNVFFESIKVGELNRDKELTYSFRYTSDWLKFDQNFQLSLAMFLVEKVFGNKTTLSFFENLLPEGEVREILNKERHLSGAFEFLKEFGEDCAGAVFITTQEKIQKKTGDKNLVSLEQVYKAVENKHSVAAIIAETNSGYLSLAGAQDKFPAIFEDGKLFLPAPGMPTTHIVKVPIFRSGVKESVYNELYCMKLANACGLNTPHCFSISDGKIPLFIIERYDRFLGNDGRIHRIHQQDFCQAQGITSEYKYEVKGGPSLKNNFELIKSNVGIKKRSENIFSFLDWLCFNFLIGNNDSHSKNISFLLKSNKIEHAPFYDLLCTAIYPKLKRQFAFKIGDRDDASRIGKNQFEMLDEQLGLRKGTVAERLLLMKAQLEKHGLVVANSLKETYPEMKIAHRINDLIQDRCRSLERQGFN